MSVLRFSLKRDAKSSLKRGYAGTVFIPVVSGSSSSVETLYVVVRFKEMQQWSDMIVYGKTWKDRTLCCRFVEHIP